ncbi:N-6 DNA methylase, partial [Candidatus Woesearchaeota archaeon]|nr:N-6 DNA methylase [Candidatus Woesearchaeota archaeon]
LRKLLGKDSLDSAYFFKFIIEKTKQQKTNEVDKDLLLNLIQLRNDLLEIRNTQEIVHLLVLRCLFIKYLEDRGIYEEDYLVNILNNGSVQKLIEAFEQIKRINGDIFKYDEFAVSDLQEGYLEKLKIFFSCFDYRTGQGTFFPYNFAKIPIQLISHVYEAFLSNSLKGTKGIYYTPSFLVKFMLSHTLQLQLQRKKNITVLDPACGSGAFLVEAFKEIVKSNNAENDYEKKVEILKNQIFGIDIDKQALQIATFSLYLSLLEKEKPSTIQEKIKNAYPILPSLINKTLTKGNSLIDKIYDNTTFDCIVANPPWGSVPKSGDGEDKRERQAIGEKRKVGFLLKSKGKVTFPEYKNVSDYQRTQAFLLKVNKWCHTKTSCALIVNNPIFFNEKAEEFRKDLLNQYRITQFYELSHLDKILFKKRVIGTIKSGDRNENVEIGTSEPCAIIIFDKNVSQNNVVQHISPKLTKFSEAFQLIHYTQKDIIIVKQEDLKNEGYWLWRIFVNGSWSDYQLIKKAYINRSNTNIECRSGFQPEKNMKSLGKPLYQNLIEPQQFEQYLIKGNLKKYNWNQDLRRKPESIFHGKRILIPVRPLKSDKLKIRGIRVDGDLIHKHNILSIKIKNNNNVIENYAPYLAVLNSSFFGYYSYQISSQWGKGGEKRSALRNSDIEMMPFPEIDSSGELSQQLTKLVKQIENNKKEGKNTKNLEDKIDEVVFELYDLLEFEKEIIKEFYQINVEREGDIVRPEDMQQYVNKYRNVFDFILADNLALNATYRVSTNLGAYVGFTIVKKEEIVPEVRLDSTEDHELFDIVKREQLNQTFFSHRLTEDKVKIYDENKFFLIKSNYFKDWTIRQAMNDANDEIGLILKELPQK